MKGYFKGDFMEFKLKCKKYGFTKPSRADLRAVGLKGGFTLAEVLITLAIVGVVAAITMPALIANIQERVKTARIQNIKQKFSKATDKMLSVTTLNGYAGTMEFVNELQNHLKIAKICTNDKLSECWPTEEVTLDNEGTTWAIKDTKTAQNLKMPKNDSVDYDDTVGIITADGTSMILTYNKLCDIDENKTIIWSNDQSSTTGCIGAIFDWNGSKMPNKLREDVVTFNARGLGEGCAFEIGSKCFGASFIPTFVTKAECESMMSSHGIKSCEFEEDYWAGAVKQCGHVNKLPTTADLAKLASLLYVGNPTISSGTGENSGLIYNGKASSFGLPEPPFHLWANNGGITSNGLYQTRGRTFTTTSTRSFSDYHTRGDLRAVCLGDEL